MYKSNEQQNDESAAVSSANATGRGSLRRLSCRASAAQALEVATQLPSIRDASQYIKGGHLVRASSLAFVLALLSTFVALRRRLRRQIRRNELSMTYIPW